MSDNIDKTKALQANSEASVTTVSLKEALSRETALTMGRLEHFYELACQELQEDKNVLVDLEDQVDRE